LIFRLFFLVSFQQEDEDDDVENSDNSDMSDGENSHRKLRAFIVVSLIIIFYLERIANLVNRILPIFEDIGE
jgi:hypothetical protein